MLIVCVGHAREIDMRLASKLLRGHYTCQPLSSRPVLIEVLSKPNCCLCDQAKFLVDRFVENLNTRGSSDLSEKSPTVEVKLTDIERPEYESLLDEYQYSIPVIRVNGEVVCEGKINMPLVAQHVRKLVRVN